MSIYLGGCDGCGPCGGKWKALAARINWAAFEGFLSTVDQGVMTGGCGAGCDYTAATNDPPTRYLRQTINITGIETNSMSNWFWDGAAWVVEDAGTFSLTCHDNGTFTYDKRKGDTLPTGCSYAFDIASEGGGNCLDGTNIGLNGLNSDTFQLWRFLAWRCGAFTATGGSGGFTGGSAADLISFLTGGGTFSGTTATIDAVTDSHVGFDAVSHFSYGPVAAPGSPGTPGQRVCRSVNFDATLSVKIDLSLPYGWQDAVDECSNLLDSNSFDLYPWRDESEILSPTCQSIPMLRYNSLYADAGFVACDHILALDGRVLGGPSEMIPADFPIPWGAYAAFNGRGAAGGNIYMVKWAMKQGSYLPFGWQVSAPKLWNFMLQQWSSNFCSLVNTYECQTEVGGENYVMCISPNLETWITFGTQFYFPAEAVLQGMIGERNNGGAWQALCRDSVPDSYGLYWDEGSFQWKRISDNVPQNPDADTPTEASCEQGCPTTSPGTCSGPGIGFCPGDGGEIVIPANNWPP